MSKSGLEQKKCPRPRNVSTKQTSMSFVQILFRLKQEFDLTKFEITRLDCIWYIYLKCAVFLCGKYCRPWSDAPVSSILKRSDEPRRTSLNFHGETKHQIASLEKLAPPRGWFKALLKPTRLAVTLLSPPRSLDPRLGLGKNPWVGQSRSGDSLHATAATICNVRTDQRRPPLWHAVWTSIQRTIGSHWETRFPTGKLGFSLRNQVSHPSKLAPQRGWFKALINLTVSPWH